MDNISTDHSNGVLTVTFSVAELIDAEMIEKIGDQLLDVLAKADEKRLLVNLDGVSFMSSLMLGKLVLLKNRCKARQTGLKICGLSDSLKEVFKLLHLNRLIDVHVDEADALQAFGVESADDADAQAGDEQLKANLQRAADGDVDALYEVGVCYAEGKGVTEDFSEALKWYHKAADKQHADAQFALGSAYAYGMQVPQDLEEAVNWYRLAAEQGHVEAQYNLGMSYCHDLAGVQDYVLAAKWYRTAAEAGYPEAQVALADLYLEGTGVAEDREEAIYWYRQAADQGNTRSVEMLERIRSETS